MPLQGAYAGTSARLGKPQVTRCTLDDGSVYALLDWDGLTIRVHDAESARLGAEAFHKALDIVDPQDAAELKDQVADIMTSLVVDRILGTLDMLDEAEESGERIWPPSAATPGVVPLAPVAPLRTCARCHDEQPEGTIVRQYGQWVCADVIGCLGRSENAGAS